MISLVRRIFAVLSAFGLAASVVAYVGSYIGMSMESMFPWSFVLHVGVFILLLPMYGIDYSVVKDRTFFWKGFAQGMPRSVVPGIRVLGLFFAVHFVLFLIRSHAAAPEIKNGEYVLNKHGQIVKVLTQSEYISLKGAELRLFATGWIFFYFVPTMYWWFPRLRQWAA